MHFVIIYSVKVLSVSYVFHVPHVLSVLHVPYCYYYYDGVICAVSVICDLCVKHDLYVSCVTRIDRSALCVFCAFSKGKQEFM